MENETELKESLQALVKDVGEHLSYLRELGVEGVEDDAELESRTVTSSVSRSSDIVADVTATQSATLRRNAEEAGRQTVPTTSAPAKLAGGDGAQTPQDQTEMAQRTTKRTPELEPPPPQETLFGEITPQDEASLPRPGETLEDIWNDIGECTRCPLSATRTHVVNSEGNRKARLMFIGEAPGADEDMQARPFVGRAGQLLNKIIEAIGLKREDVMIGNVNRCRPPQNRTPTLAEAATCKPFLLREIAIIKPEVIVVLGNTAMKNLLDTKEGITKLRGKFQDYQGIKVMPTFHPAYLLRDPSKKRETWEDMKTVRDYLEKQKSGVRSLESE